MKIQQGLEYFSYYLSKEQIKALPESVKNIKYDLDIASFENVNTKVSDWLEEK